jgi:hypothetical protein
MAVTAKEIFERNRSTSFFLCGQEIFHLTSMHAHPRMASPKAKSWWMLSRNF